jgi:hypothetical protein
MPHTDFCDVFASVHEDGFNRIVEQIAAQRPSLFNYGTDAFVKNYRLLCCKPEWIHPEVSRRGNPIVSRVPFLPIPGYTGNYGLEWNFSLSKLQIDFEPTNKFNLPSELGNKLDKQCFAIKAIVCGGITCPNPKLLEDLIIYPEPYRPDFVVGKKDQRSRKDEKGEPRFEPNKPLQGLPFDEKSINCFTIGLFVVLKIGLENRNGEPVLGLKLQGLEIVDIKPEGLENSMECYMKTTLRLGILPQLTIAFNDIALTIGNFISIVPTPISGRIPFNPSIEKDTVSVFLNLQNP